MSLLSSLNVGRQALATQALALETIAENLAQADDPSFSRRRIIRQSSPAAGSAGGVLTRQGPLTGAGPEVRAVVRERDQFVESRLRGAISEGEETLVAARAWQSLESLFDEPGGPASLSQLWNDWESALQDLTGHPNDLSVRQVVIDRSADLARGIRRLAEGIVASQDAEQDALEQEVTRANAIIGEIAHLNGAIRQAEQGRGPRGEERFANDLRDRRDALLRELSGLVGITVREDGTAGASGEGVRLRVEIGGTVVVDGDQVLYHVGWERSATGQPDDVAQGPRVFLTSAGSDAAAAAQTVKEVAWPAGAVRGRLQSWRAGADLWSELDRLAQGLIDGTSAILMQGVDLYGSPGVPLFSGTGAADIAVNEALKNERGEYDPRKLATKLLTADGVEKDNGIALSLLDWARSGAAEGGSPDHPFAIYTGSVVPMLAEGTRQAETRHEAAEARRQHLEDLRQSESGVSPDEELVELLSAERAYQAAAQLISALDQALGTVIEVLGGAGR